MHLLAEEFADAAGDRPLVGVMSSSAQMAPSPPRIQKMLKPRNASTEAMRRVGGNRRNVDETARRQL